ncbi:MAG: hypothetical protein ACLPSW_20785 [Roseiarcus sp.]
MVEISRAIGEIVASAQEQSTGLQQVNVAVSDMDQVTQKNAAMVEETTAATHALAAETERLAKLVSSYSVRSDESDGLREELKKAAPHAFRAASKPAPAGRAKPAPAHAPAMKAAVNAPLPAAPAENGGEGDWQEF